MQKIQRYPLNVHHPDGRTKQVGDPEAERQALAEGWLLKRPPLPIVMEPEPLPPMTLDERLMNLEDAVAELRQTVNELTEIVTAKKGRK